MSELRIDPLTGRRVLIAEERATRPNEFLEPSEAPRADHAPRAECVFCAGNERETPAAVYEAHGPDGLWRQRVVPNKYPALAPPGAEGYAGAHEVIIETRDHRTLTGELSVEEFDAVLTVYAARLAHWRADGRFPYRLLFKNVGRSAGASLSHLHSQLVAMPEAPPLVEAELKNLARHDHPQTAWRDWVSAEVASGERVVAESEAFVALCPTVSRAAYEAWVMPRRRAARFEETAADPGRRAELAGLLHALVGRLERRIYPWGYNLMVHTAPESPGVEEVFHWRIEIVPRTASLAGFELATGVLLNTVSPERAAAALRA